MSNRFLLLFASETGQAKAIAEIIRDQAVERGLEPELHCFSQYEKKFELCGERVLVVVVSTTGEGDPPETMRRAWRKLKKKTLAPNFLTGSNFSLLGLGDTNYDNFCNMGKMLNERLLELGANSFYPPGFADDAVGLELVVEPWMEGLWAALTDILGLSLQNTTNQAGPEEGIVKTEGCSTEASEFSGDNGRTSSIANTTVATGLEASPLPLAVKPGTSELATVSDISTEQSKMAAHTVCDLPSTTSEVADHGPATRGAPEATSDRSNQLSDSEVSSIIEELRSSLDINAELTLPKIPPSYLKLDLQNQEPLLEGFPFNKVSYRLQSHISMATIVQSRPLTNKGAVKKTLEVALRIQDDVTYEPGDALGFVCPNSSAEVDWLMDRLGLSTAAQHTVRLSIMDGTTKKRPTLPTHIPTPCTVKQLLMYCLDIRAVPKKVFLCLLAEHCTNGGDKQRLKELASRQGGTQYTKLFTEARTDLLDVLNSFPSCRPPLEALIEHLPRLQPRYYSVTSSQHSDPHTLTVAFNVEILPVRLWGTKALKQRRGLATGWLEHVTENCPSNSVQVPIFTRVLNPFRLPSDPECPILMLGTGTGVVPFMGFLRHMKQKVGGATCRRAWLFFGCRHPDLDYLYKEELDHFHSTGLLTKLTVAFSRLQEGGVARYVQDCVREEWKECGKWIVEHRAAVYMCGDALTMVKDTQKAVEEVITKYICQVSSGSAESAATSIAELKDEGRFRVDLWT